MGFRHDRGCRRFAAAHFGVLLSPPAVLLIPACSIAPQINLASKVIAALRTLETGQFFSASLAMRANAASSRFGTWARNVRADRLMRKPWPSGSSVTAASVVSSVGV